MAKKKIIGRCRICGEERQLTEEHYIPRAAGGGVKAVLYSLLKDGPLKSIFATKGRTLKVNKIWYNYYSMPSRNVVKVDVPDSYYHVYARGHGRQKIFRDDGDFEMFLSLFARHLSNEPSSNVVGRQYPHLQGEVELLSYCLMGNHFHLLLYQHCEGAMSKLMRSVMTGYSMYFNKKYHSSGSLFESRYKASRISSDPYLMHISRYIHLNPKKWMEYPHSSIHSYYLGAPEWLKPGRVIELFETLPKYADFLNDYHDYKKSLVLIKTKLANEIRS